MVNIKTRMSFCPSASVPFFVVSTAFFTLSEHVWFLHFEAFQLSMTSIQNAKLPGKRKLDRQY